MYWQYKQKTVVVNFFFNYAFFLAVQRVLEVANIKLDTGLALPSLKGSEIVYREFVN